jgi:hypothetical protein
MRKKIPLSKLALEKRFVKKMTDCKLLKCACIVSESEEENIFMHHRR